MIVRGAKGEAWAWLHNRADIVPSPEFKAIEAVDDHGRIHGMVGFDGWTENSVVLTIALDNASCLRSLLFPIFDYAFNQAGRGIALAMVRGGNKRSLRLCKHVGMEEVHRVRDGISIGEDIVIFEMRREHCRWLTTEHRKVA
jgi:hypothetical protein